MSLEDFKKRTLQLAKHMDPKRFKAYIESFEYNYELDKLSNGTDEKAKQRLDNIRAKDFEDRKRMWEMLYDSSIAELRIDYPEGTLFHPAMHDAAMALAERAMVDDGYAPPHFTKFVMCSSCGGVLLPADKPSHVDSCIWCASPKYQSWRQIENGQ